MIFHMYFFVRYSEYYFFIPNLFSLKKKLISLKKTTQHRGEILFSIVGFNSGFNDGKRNNRK